MARLVYALPNTKYKVVGQFIGGTDPRTAKLFGTPPQASACPNFRATLKFEAGICFKAAGPFIFKRITLQHAWTKATDTAALPRTADESMTNGLE